MEILKTYKLYIGGQFPRTESGRTYLVTAPDGKAIANACLASKKDVRNAVQVARKAQSSWAAKTAFNKGQILYRIAEVLEGRKAQFIEEICSLGASIEEATQEVQIAIDRCVYYAGWADKYQALSSSVNPVASSHFNFSVPEPMGVVGLVACQETALSGLVSQLLPIIVGGNTAILIANSTKPLCAITLGEVLATSDVPGGVVNILTGDVAEMLPTLAGHMDVNALCLAKIPTELMDSAQESAIDNLKRCIIQTQTFSEASTQGMQYITDFQEIKTTWHPIEQVAGGMGGY
ncbi:MAG: aldehyde dehydrogenase family protein [Crocinitomicaceae bacterium]